MKSFQSLDTNFLSKQLSAAKHAEIIHDGNGQPVWFYGDRDVREAATDMLRSAYHLCATLPRQTEAAL